MSDTVLEPSRPDQGHVSIPGQPELPSTDVIHAYVARGRRLRAEYIAGLASGLGSRLRRAVRGAADSDTRATAGGGLGATG